MDVTVYSLRKVQLWWIFRYMRLEPNTFTRSLHLISSIKKHAFMKWNRCVECTCHQNKMWIQSMSSNKRFFFSSFLFFFFVDKWKLFVIRYAMAHRFAQFVNVCYKYIWRHQYVTDFYCKTYKVHRNTYLNRPFPIVLCQKNLSPVNKCEFCTLWKWST